MHNKMLRSSEFSQSQKNSELHFLLALICRKPNMIKESVKNFDIQEEK